MLLLVKSLKEVKNEINEQLGVVKKLNPQNGYYFHTHGAREYSMLCSYEVSQSL